MTKQKIYRINENQLKVIVESQKSSPQLQTEVLDSLASGFGKLLTFTFKQSVNAFKYFSGIGVNVFIGNKYTSTGKVKLKKNNPLSPLSLYNAKLTSLPQGYEKLFTTISTGIKGVSESQPKDAKPVSYESILKNLKFDNTNGITYPIKFEFQNLDKKAKENSVIMMTTWGLIFNVVCAGQASEPSTMTFNLVSFQSQGPSFDLFLKQLAQSEKKDQELIKSLSKFNTTGRDTFSLIFSNASQSRKFETVMAKQIQDHMKVLIGHLNSDMGVKKAIQVPTIKVTVANTLIGDVKLQAENQKAPPVDEIDDDIEEIQRQIKLYQDQDQYRSYIQDLNTILNKLALKRKEISK